MKYSKDEIMQYIYEEDVKFIRLAFCDIYGRQKNISIMSDEIGRAFEYGIAIDASAIEGFGGDVHSDLFLHPDPSTLSVLPWRPEHGKVVRMFCRVAYPDGTNFEADTRTMLEKAVDEAKEQGISFSFGTEMEFYLFKRNGEGEPTKEPYDCAGYMDIAPEDKGENVRREICLTLEQMGIKPESSHHEEGPGQNEIDFKYSDPVSAADNAVTFKAVVNMVASRSGLCADFSPKPLEYEAGNGMHINISAESSDGKDIMKAIIAGILEYIPDMTVFLNCQKESYKRFGSSKAPMYISWSEENRSQLIRIPAAQGEFKRAELRSADPMCNPYIALTLIIKAGLKALKENMKPAEAADFNIFTAPDEITSKYKVLPKTLEEAKKKAAESAFTAECLPETIIEKYTK